MFLGSLVAAASKWAPLMEAARELDVQKVNKLLARGEPVLASWRFTDLHGSKEITDSQGRTVLHHAFVEYINGQPQLHPEHKEDMIFEIANKLLTHGSNHDTPLPGKEKKTLLILTIEQGRPAIADWLLDREASFTTALNHYYKNPGHCCVLFFAISFNSFQFMKKACEYMHRAKPSTLRKSLDAMLWKSVRKGNPNIVLYLLECGANPKQLVNGKSLLWNAYRTVPYAGEGQLQHQLRVGKLIEVLLEEGNLDSEDERTEIRFSNSSPLMMQMLSFKTFANITNCTNVLYLIGVCVYVALIPVVVSLVCALAYLFFMFTDFSFSFSVLYVLSFSLPVYMFFKNRNTPN